MSKVFRLAMLSILLVVFVCSFASSAQARVETILWNTTLKGTFIAGSPTPYKYHYFPFGAEFNQSPDIGGGAEMLKSSTDLLGVAKIGSTTGYITMQDDADILRFRFALPETFVDTGSQSDLKIEFYVSEQITFDSITYDVAIYEFNNTTAIIEDQFTVGQGEDAGWFGLVTNSDGIGNDADIDADDILIITISPESYPPIVLNHAANIYGCRIRYRPGFDSSEE